MRAECVECYFYARRAKCCDYYIKTNKRRTMSKGVCTSLLPKALVPERAGIREYWCQSEIKHYPCITKGGRIFDAKRIMRGANNLEYINNVWIVADKALTPKEIRDAKPLPIEDYM